MLRITEKIAIYILFITPFAAYPQSNQDSLLKQINEIEITLNSPIESEENLFLNTVSFQSFYDILSPMGEWIQITKEDIDEDLNDGEGQSFTKTADGEEDLLFIWKPNTGENWKPFLNGSWEYTDHGWLWVSSDNWGNSTYHYGRWWNSQKYGWVWLPGYTWSPGWVRWRESENAIGWAPLSPKAEWQSENGITNTNNRLKNNDNDWVFVDYNNFTNETNNFNVINASQNSSLVKTSSEITNIKVEDDRIVNSGPNTVNIEKKTGKKFSKKKLQFTKGNNKPVVGNNDITLSRENFNKYSLDKDTKKPKILDKPKKYKKSERVKKMFKKWKKNKRKPHREINPPRRQ